MYANHAPQFIAPHIPQIFHEFVLMFSIMVYCRSRVWFLVLSRGGGGHLLFICLYTVVCVCLSQTPNLSLCYPLPSGSHGSVFYL